MIVAIDGPAGSGKSSTARALAAETGLLYLDTGAMYRAVALCFIEAGAHSGDEAAEKILEHISIDFSRANGSLTVLLNGRDVTEDIRSREVTDMSSRVSALPLVRTRLVAEQRKIAVAQTSQGGGVIVEGRDIGTVVFPHADVKIFLEAAPEERARRRIAELKQKGIPFDAESIRRDLVERDLRDSTRSISPLRIADDAIVFDTTGLTLEEQVAQILDIIRERHA